MDTYKTLLSVSVGRHRLGYAVFTKYKLAYYGMASLKQFNTKQDLDSAVERVMNRLFGKFKINEMAVTKLNKFQKKIELLTVITARIEYVCNEKRLPVTEYSNKFVNQKLSNEHPRPTKDKTIQFLVSEHPELEHYLNQKQFGQRLYYTHLFQAIAVGLVHMKEIDKNANLR